MNWQVDGEYRGSDFTAAVTLGNPDVLVGSGKWLRLGASQIPVPALLAISSPPLDQEMDRGRRDFEITRQRSIVSEEAGSNPSSAAG